MQNDQLLIARMTLSKPKGGYEINLVGGMAVTSGSNSGIQEFLVYATNSYSTSGKQRVDCVQVKLGEDTISSCW